MTRFYGFSVRSIAALFLALLVPTGLWPQNTRGPVNGLVKDPTGAVIASATLTVTEQNTGLIFTIRTQPDGAYLVPNLSSGRYQFPGEAKDFKRLSVEGLKLDAGTTLTQNCIFQFDLARSKSLWFAERYRVQVGAEAVDLFNTPQYGKPGQSLGSGLFGIITNTDGFTRRIMDFGLKLYR